jgi:ADP-heptose:LPS heptosyltransferase
VISAEGGLHHCAAALGVPAVVIRGGFIGPRVTGYAGQVDLFVESAEWPLGCGVRSGCPHCAAAMESINRTMVAAALRKLLEEKCTATAAATSTA